MNSSPLLCGPLIRYTDHRNAVIWLELDSDLEVVVDLFARQGEALGPPLEFRAWPVKIGSTYYAWINCGPLLPSTWYEYSIQGVHSDGKREELWPDRRLSGTLRPSVFRTMPRFSYDQVRVAFGSCRAGFPPSDPKALEEGLDALNTLAFELVDTADERETAWPHLFLFTGDQIYGDELSAEKKRAFSRSRENPVVPNQATTYDAYASLYREAWTTVPQVRWVLSCVPSYMICDDHDVIDDWNITDEWIRERLASPSWIRLLRDGLLAYWIYQGAGNLSPRRFRTDERCRQLTPRFRSPFRNVTHRLNGLFRAYVTRHRKVDWGYDFTIPGTQFVVGDTRMNRKLTGKRLLMDDYAWTRFANRALDTRSRNVFLVVPGPVLVGHPMHDLLSRMAESIEGNPSSTAGAVVGGFVGTLVGGPVGGAIGALIGSRGGEYLLDRYGEDLIRHADIELWGAFPSSFNRMLTLFEQLVDGINTTPKRFVGVIAGDVHHSNVLRGDLQNTSRRKPLLHFTMSPLQRKVGKGDQNLLKDLESGAFYVDAINALERPPFVETQRKRLDWYPLDRNGNRVGFDEVDEWSYFGKFVGELELNSFSIRYRYRQAQNTGSRLSLEDITDRIVNIL